MNKLVLKEAKLLSPTEDPEESPSLVKEQSYADPIHSLKSGKKARYVAIQKSQEAVIEKVMTGADGGHGGESVRGGADPDDF